MSWNLENKSKIDIWVIMGYMDRFDKMRYSNRFHPTQCCLGWPRRSSGNELLSGLMPSLSCRALFHCKLRQSRSGGLDGMSPQEVEIKSLEATALKLTSCTACSECI